jgi:hypothetical protein
VWKAFDTSEGVEVAWNTLCLDEVPRTDKKRILNEIKILEKVRGWVCALYHVVSCLSAFPWCARGSARAHPSGLARL